MNKCINIIKTTIKSNKKGFILQNNKSNLRILTAFLKIGVIKFIKKNTKNKNLLVYINYFDNKPIFTNIINMFKPSNKKFINLKNLKNLSYNKKYIIILSTSKGILNNYEAINANVGGLVIAEIWN